MDKDVLNAIELTRQGLIEVRSEFNAHLIMCAERQNRRDSEVKAIWERMDKNQLSNHKEYINLDVKLDSNAKEIRNDLKSSRVMIIVTLLAVVGALVTELFFKT